MLDVRDDCDVVGVLVLLLPPMVATYAPTIPTIMMITTIMTTAATLEIAEA